MVTYSCPLSNISLSSNIQQGSSKACDILAGKWNLVIISESSNGQTWFFFSNSKISPKQTISPIYSADLAIDLCVWGQSGRYISFKKSLIFLRHPAERVHDLRSVSGQRQGFICLHAFLLLSSMISDALGDGLTQGRSKRLAFKLISVSFHLRRFGTGRVTSHTLKCIHCFCDADGTWLFSVRNICLIVSQRIINRIT